MAKYRRPSPQPVLHEPSVPPTSTSASSAAGWGSRSGRRTTTLSPPSSTRTRRSGSPGHRAGSGPRRRPASSSSPGPEAAGSRAADRRPRPARPAAPRGFRLPPSARPGGRCRRPCPSGGPEWCGPRRRGRAETRPGALDRQGLPERVRHRAARDQLITSGPGRTPGSARRRPGGPRPAARRSAAAGARRPRWPALARGCGRRG